MEDRIVKYRIMHEDTPVVEIDFYTDELVLFNKEFLPFPLRNKERLGAVAVFEWIMKRINHLYRPNMDKVCQVRLTGKDRDKIIRDSYGVSFTDNFWINPDNTNITWEELVRLIDTNAALNLVALTGEIPNIKQSHEKDEL